MMMIRNYNDHNDEHEDSYWFDNNVDNKKDFYEQMEDEGFCQC